jgi:hypothetical protein
MEQIITLADDSSIGAGGTKIVLDTKTGQVRDASGKVVRHLALVPADVHTAAEIPSYLSMYENAAYRADDVAPIFPVDHRKDKYRNESSDDAFLRVNVKGSIQGAVPQIDPKTSLNDYSAVDQYVGSYVPAATEQEEVGTRFRTRQAAARRCKTALYISREHDVWDLLTTSGSWDATVVATIAAGAKWNGGATSDPILDLQTRIEASAMRPTGIWLNQRTANAFLRHASVREHMRQHMGDGATARDVQSISDSKTGDLVDFRIPGFPPFHVVDAKSRATVGGPLPFILGNHVVLTASPGGDLINTIKTFRVKGPQGVGYEAREYRVEDRGPQGGTMLVASVADVPVMTGNNVGGLIINAWQ